MFAIEFRAKVEEGMKVPRRYRDKLKEVVRVIILADAQTEPKTPNLIDQLFESPIKVAGFQPLLREEIYART